MVQPLNFLSMKIINFGLDSSCLDKKSVLANRLIEYGNLVERYDVVVPSFKAEKIVLSEKATVYGSGGVNKLTRFYRIYRLGKKLCQENKYEVITAQDQYYLALIGLRLSRIFKIGLEIQVHGFEKYRGLRKLISRYVLPRADAVRAVSRRLKKQLADNFKIAANKITVAPIYSEKVRGLKDEARSSDIKFENNKFIFLTVGRLTPVKNTDLQIKAMAETAKKYPQAELWIVGEGPLKNNFRFLIENLRLSGKVKLLNQKNGEELEKIYNLADAFLLTSNSEGWGLAVIEAAVHNLPIIMTDVGCAGEVIKNGESGIIIPVGDKNLLIKAMKNIIQDKDLRLRLSGAAKKAVEALPSKQETLNLYLMSWQKAAGRK